MQTFTYQPSFTARRVTHRPDFQSYLERSQFDPFTLNLKGKTLMEVIEAAIQAKSKRSPNYRKQLSCLINNLKELERVYHTTLKPIQVTDIFWDYFVSFCDERGLKASTTLTMVNQLRSVLNWAVKYNAEISPTFGDAKVRTPHSQQIALTADEVSRIKYFDIDRFYSNRRSDFREKMHRVRDMFLLSVALFQRHSDMVRISKSCFDRNIFKITQQKTGSLAVVNIDKFSCDPKSAYEILERYNYEAPYKGEISNYNHTLHALMKDIGFTEPIRIEEWHGGQMVARDVPKWKLIASHTARRTAITIAVLRGHNIHSVRRASGHEDLRSLDKYIRDE